MLLLKGNQGKSVIVNAIQKYNNAKVYVYNNEPIQTLDSYFVSSKYFSVKEFCESIFKDINGLGAENHPVHMIVTYTNLSDGNEIGLIEDYANMFEKMRLVSTVVVTCKL